MIKIATAACLLLGAPLLMPQETEKKIVIADFEGELGEWAGMALSEAGGQAETDSKSSLTREAGAGKPGQGALSHKKVITPKTVRVLTLQRPMDLREMKSLRLWVRCSHETSVDRKSVV